MIALRVGEAFFAQKYFNLFSGRLAGIHKLNIFADGLLDHVSQDRVVRAAQDQCVRAEFLHFREIFRRDRIRFRFVGPTLFGKRYKQADSPPERPRPIADARRIASKYALLETVASVAMTPIRACDSPFVISTAFRPPGPITPTTSIPIRSRILGNANADAVLQATTSILIPRDARNSEFSIAYRSTVAKRFRPVRHAGRIAQINKMLIRQTVVQCTINRQAADARIKDTDW